MCRSVADIKIRILEKCFYNISCACIAGCDTHSKISPAYLCFKKQDKTGNMISINFDSYASQENGLLVLGCKTFFS
jgi:hypothetical protein